MSMNTNEVKALIDLVTDAVICRLQSSTDGSEQQRLKSNLESVSERFSNLPEVLRGAKSVLACHDFNGLGSRIDKIREFEKNPPDTLYEELKKLEEKIRHLQDEDTYERKLPWRHQINLNDLISILVEVLEILRKLYGRSLPPQG